MKVSELVTLLQKLPDQDVEVLVNVRVHTQAYGVAQVTPWDVDQAYGGATIEISLPENMHVVKRKRLA
jgi:hypothetical protein